MPSLLPVARTRRLLVLLTAELVEAVCARCLGRDLDEGRAPCVRRGWTHPLACFCSFHRIGREAGRRISGGDGRMQRLSALSAVTCSES